MLLRTKSIRWVEIRYGKISSEEFEGSRHTTFMSWRKVRQGNFGKKTYFRRFRACNRDLFGAEFYPPYANEDL